MVLASGNPHTALTGISGVSRVSPRDVTFDGLYITGQGIDVATVSDAVEPRQFADSNAADHPVTTGATVATLLMTAVNALRQGSIRAPAELDDLLSRAVTERAVRDSEDLDTWATRLADEASQCDD